MRKSKFSEQQIAAILRQAAEGAKIPELCREAGISVQTFYRWRLSMSGARSTTKRLREVMGENSRLRKLVADLSLDKEMLQGVIRRRQ